MFKRDTIYLILILAGVIWFSELYSSPFLKNKFEVSIKGNRGDLPYLKLKADYRTLKKGRYCKGAFISYGNSNWKCSNDGDPKCRKKYKCKRVNRKFNIRTESIRIRNAMKKTGMIRPKKHKIWISRKPKRRKRRRKGERQLSPNTFSDVQYLGTGPIRGIIYGTTPEERIAQTKQRKVTVKQLREKMSEADALAELRDEKRKEVAKKIAKKGFKKAKRVAETRRNDSMEELDDIEDNEFEESLDISEDSTESDIDLKDEPRENTSMVIDDTNDSIFQLLAFSAGYVSISNTDQSITTIEVAYTPRVKFGEDSTFGLRGHYGIHQYSTLETNELTSAVILITDMKLMLYKYFNNIILEVGIGSQSWGATSNIPAQSFSTVSGTLGYRFDQHILKAVDRVYVHAMQIASADETISSLEFGIGISF
jgi:hypothetical protein